MSRKFKVAYFAHSLTSDWNNGNAHFLRGLLRSLVRLQHDVTIFEAAGNWSRENLASELGGRQSMEQFARTYPELSIELYDLHNETGDAATGARLPGLLAEMDIVIMHEWSPPLLAQLLLNLRSQLGYRLLFHDTHHRASSSPGQIALFGIDQFDGVLAFGESLREIYRRQFSIAKVWTLHEAADTTVFSPRPADGKSIDTVWIGNWGDEERSAEIRQYLLAPASAIREYHFQVYGVRYPEEGLTALREAGVCYGGYLPNLEAPNVYAKSRLTVHVPRQHYKSAMKGIPTIRVFEALACGVPLISAPWQDTEQLFRPGDYLTVRNGEEMGRAMKHLLSNGESARHYAASGLETILAAHTCDHRAKQLSGIFEEVVS